MFSEATENMGVVAKIHRVKSFMSPFSYSLWTGIILFIVVAILLGAFTQSFLGVSILGTNQEFEVISKAPSKGLGKPPVFAYWISGTQGDGQKIMRLLKAIYHPRNRYLLHLDIGSLQSERIALARSVHSEALFKKFGNVEVIGKTYAVDRTGASGVASVLHGASILLRIFPDWDWFITLSASDYPLVTQDDLLHVFTSVPRDLNFIDHTSDLGWKEAGRFHKIVVDPSLYMKKNTRFFFGTETRKTPEAFKLFTGSPWVILTRSFLEHCIYSYENLPRKLLMYFTNVPYPIESYFQTVICNTPEFKNTTVNDDLRYFLWDDPPKLEPIFLNRSHYKPMLKSGAVFARPFLENDEVLKKIDERVLRRPPGGVTRGKWCGSEEDGLCLGSADIDEVKIGKRGRRMKSLVNEIVSSERLLHLNQCKF